MARHADCQSKPESRSLCLLRDTDHKRRSAVRRPLGVRTGLRRYLGPISGIATSNASRSYELAPNGLAGDVLSFTDGPHEHNYISAFLLGLDYVKTANDEKTDPDIGLDVTLSEKSPVYIFLDNRVRGGNLLPWMVTAGWVHRHWLRHRDPRGGERQH